MVTSGMMGHASLDAVADATPVLGCLVGGEWIVTGETFDNVSPVDGSVVSRVTEAGREVVDLAVAKAREALGSSGFRDSVGRRARLLERVAEGIDRRLDELAAAESADTGKPLAQARGIDIPRGAANFRTFARLVRDLPVECFETEVDGGVALNYAVRSPVGVVAVVCPWNLPFLLATWKVAPALAAGNSVVVKPSEMTPTTTTLLAEIIAEAGVPDGVFNVVHGRGPDAAGEFLVRHPGVDAVTFTGESATGSAIMRAVADGVRPVSFELGGKNPALVFADADFDSAVEETARSVFSNCGQVCLCTERVYVERGILGDFTEALRERAERIVIGRPDDPGVTMGPLISLAHREKVLACLGIARSEGAEFVTGGGVPEFGDERDGGAYIEPTILAGLDESSRCVKEEIFGPVCHIAPFDSEEEAVRLANDTRYGLAAAVRTTDLSRAHRVARRIRAGIVWVNAWFLRDLRTPFGGIGLSGIGREGGVHSLGFYSELTNVCIRV